MKREFASLSPQEALHLAIFVEDRNNRLYRQFGEMFRDFGDPDSREIAAVFFEMADEECVHGSMRLQRYAERYGSQLCNITEAEVRELVELPRMTNGNIFAIARSGATTIPRSHALEIALAAEVSAQRFYGYLFEYTDDPDLRALYGELSEFEDGHVNRIHQKMEAVRRDGIFDQA